MTKLDEANLREKFGTDGRFEFALRLSTASGFTPPKKVKELSRSKVVGVNLALGIHYFYTAVEKGDVSFGALLDFLAHTEPNVTPHRFLGRSLSSDEEEANVLSNRFARFLGIGFMAEYVDATWFFPLPKQGRAVLPTPGGEIKLFRSKRNMRWPDYLAAPFNPERSSAKSLGAFYPLEFKGRSASIDFEDSQFRAWLDQSTNISIQSAGRKLLRSKSWVLALNYRCRDKPARHEASTFLIHDPQIGPENAPLPASSAPIIRAHLARQCRKLGLGSMSAFVESGAWPGDWRHRPQVYRIRHRDSRFRDRRYVGRFIAWGLDGEPVVASSGSFFPPLLDRDFDGYFDANFHGRSQSLELRARIRGRQPRGIDVHVRSSNPLWTEDRVRLFLNSLMGASIPAGAFIGQDAKMLRRCMSTPLTDELSGGEFATVFEIADPGVGDAADRKEVFSAGAIQVLRNGSVIANSELLEPVAEEFWVRGG